MFINPFPFGNTNTIVDAVSQGVVGICRSHREVHSNIDEGLFGRLKLPKFLVAHSEEEMVSSSLRLIEDSALRGDLRDHLVNNGYAKPLFSGEESVFCEYFVGTQTEHPIRTINEPR
jgi:predicted O-linked N-acetylglucosamine transferase (SPINDLY family)